MSGAWHFAGKYSYNNKKIIVVYALLISFIWHLLWSVMFKVEFNSNNLNMATITRTVFLGDFLDRSHLTETLTASGSEVSKKTIAFIEDIYITEEILPKKVYFNEIKQRELSHRAVDFDRRKAESIFLDYPQISAAMSVMNIARLKGPLQKRDILFMPPKPKIPQWMEDTAQFNIKCKLLVDKYGKVIFVEQLSSSGYLEIDLLARKYLKRWRFSSCNPLQVDTLQWGTIVVKFDSLNDNY